MIHFVCEHCRRPVRVSDACGGKQGRCPHCHQVVSIPGRGAVAIEALAAALGPGEADPADETTGGFVPPPPAVPMTPGHVEEEFVLPKEGDEDLDDTVILPAEGITLPVEPSSPPRHRRHAQKAPAVNARRTFLIVVAVIIVLAAAGIAVVLISQRT